MDRSGLDRLEQYQMNQNNNIHQRYQHLISSVDSTSIVDDINGVNDSSDDAISIPSGMSY